MVDTSPAPEDESLASFILQAGGAGDQALEVRAFVANIGQGAQNDVVLDDDTVSTTHARLEYGDGSWRLTDLESKNGTYVDGLRLEPGTPTPLPDDAVVAFGALRLAFRPRDDLDPATVGAAYQPARVQEAAVRRAGYRLPVWIVLITLLLVLLLVVLVLALGGEVEVNGPVSELLTPLITDSHLTGPPA